MKISGSLKIHGTVKFDNSTAILLEDFILEKGVDEAINEHGKKKECHEAFHESHSKHPQTDE